MDYLDQAGEERRAHIKRLSADCEHLLDELHLKYPHLVDLPPALKVEDVLLDICKFHVIDIPLPLGQIALCDFSTSTVIFNSELKLEDGDIQHLRHGTLAHELGHIRLHQEEISEEFQAGYSEFLGIVVDPRSYQKEREADLYASLFLMPLSRLLKEPEVQKMLRNLKDRKAMGSGVLWKLVYRLAAKFQVSPAFVKRSLRDFGWVSECPQNSRGRRDLKLAFQDSSKKSRSK